LTLSQWYKKESRGRREPLLSRGGRGGRGRKRQPFSGFQAPVREDLSVKFCLQFMLKRHSL